MTSVVRIFFYLLICTAIDGCKNLTTTDSPPGDGAAGTNEPHAIADEDLPDPIGHVVNVHQRPWNITIAPDTRIAPTAAPPQSKWGETAVRGTRRAVIVSNETPSDAGGQIDSIYFTTDGTTYFRIDGIPLPYRPLGGIVWASDRYLVLTAGPNRTLGSTTWLMCRSGDSYTRPRSRISFISINSGSPLPQRRRAENHPLQRSEP